MAQDLVHKHPEAVHLMANGFYSVDYAVLDTEMVAPL
ncbi:hypothetical protein BH23PAT1_BH23PAT1_0870 [soil metagenome]